MPAITASEASNAPSVQKPSPRYLQRLRGGGGAKEPKPKPTSTPRGSGSAATSPRRSWWPWGAAPDKAAPPADTEIAAAAARIQTGFRAKLSARRKPSAVEDPNRSRAASRIQGSFRRRGKATVAAAQASLHKAGREAKESIDESSKLAQGRLLNSLIAKGLTKGIRAAAATDPWIPKWVAKALPPPLIAVIHAASERKMHAELETSGKGSAQLRQWRVDALDPATWPQPPPFSRPLRLIRAKFLHAVNPADKSLCYGLFHSPSTLLTWIVLYSPPIFPLFPFTIALWLFYFLCVITVQDEFTLFNYIASFKTWCFVMCGVLPVFGDFFVFYFDISSRQIDDHGDDPNAIVARHLYDRDYSLFSWYNLVSNRAFIALWVVCWIVFARYRHVRTMHYAQEEGGAAEHSGRQRIHHDLDEVQGPKPTAPRERNQVRVAQGKSEDDSGVAIYNAVHTGDQDTGDHEQTLLMKWDAIAILLHVILGLLDLYFRMRISMVQAVFDPTREELLFETFICTTLSLLAAPFVLWKLPVVGELIHQLRPTGFDEAGGLRLTMSLSDMKKKHERTQAVPSRGFFRKRAGGGLEQLEQLVGARQRPRAFSAPAHLGGTRCVSSPPSRPVQASSAAPGAGAADLV